MSDRGRFDNLHGDEDEIESEGRKVAEDYEEQREDDYNEGE